MNENTVTIRNTAVSIGELPRRGIHCYMLYAIDDYDVSTQKVYLGNPIAINVQKLDIPPTDAECQAIISKHDQCPPEIAEAKRDVCGVLFRVGSRKACTFFCVNSHGVIVKELHHACL